VNPLLTSAAIGYLLGSVPFGYLLVRIFHGEDVRQTGSGNIGATNVSRTSFPLGVITLLLDACKGLAAVIIARLLFPGNIDALVIAALFAVAGHIFPVWLKFRGGKGVATGLGSFILLAPKAVLICIAVFIALVALFRYISLASIAAVALLPILIYAFHPHQSAVILLVLATSLLILIKHRGNIKRLLAGSEPKFHVEHELR
jgi:acyl phosphate:glycerol-3-phosphate acyltransferase